MKRFKDIIDEQAQITGRFETGSYSKEDDWLYIDKNKTILVRDNLSSSKKYKVFKTTNNYFLTDKNDNYKGYIEYIKIKKDVIQITASSSEIKRGFYNIMFSVILSDDINEILSDNSLSVNAIKSYEKLSKNQNYYLTIFTGIGYIEFDTKKLKSNYKYTLSIRTKMNLKEHFNKYNNRLNEKRDSQSMIQKSFNQETDFLDWKLFGESFLRDSNNDDYYQ